MKILILLISLTNLCLAQNFWPSEFPEHVNEFIYNETHFKCAYSDYIDGIVVDEIIEFPNGRTYTADFSVYGDIGNGHIAVDETFEGELYVSDLVCPKI